MGTLWHGFVIMADMTINILGGEKKKEREKKKSRV